MNAGPYYFDVKATDKGVTWKCLETHTGKPIARSPARYATIAEANDAIEQFKLVVGR